MNDVVWKRTVGLGLFGGVLLLWWVGCACASGPAIDRGQAPASGSVDLARHTMTPDGRERLWLIHTPPQFDAAKTWPVVLVFHGGGGNAEQAREHYQLNAAADRYGFIAVYPEGISKRAMGRRFATWNVGHCCGHAYDEQVDDVAFVKLLRTELIASWGADPARIYATGISNGGMMSTRLACELGDQIAAVAPVASPGYVEDCKPTRAVPTLFVHGKQDPCALYEGGASCGGCWQRAMDDMLGTDSGAQGKFACTSAVEQAQFWRAKAKCSDSVVTTYNQGDVVCTEHRDCDASEFSVGLCTLENGGHHWPGATLGCNPERKFCQSYLKATGPLLPHFSANEMIWQFFTRHRLDRAM